ncbi:MAG: ABC transporter permease [Candidatus Omnitrophica bacterium]|nr:ABC transporter permease [Candidatus Omnitrophota bacterium]
MFGYIKDIIRHRELLLRLAFLDFKLKYRNPFLGVLWAAIMPLINITVYWWLFSVMMKMEVKDYPFFIYMMTAMFPWMYFQGSVLSASTSLIDKSSLIKRVNVPREIIPLASVFSNLLNLLINLTLLFILLMVSGVGLSVNLVFLPLVILMQTIMAAGFALFASALNVRHRDTRYIMETVLISLFFLTPAVYSLELFARFPPAYLKIYLLNPFVGIVTLYRLCLLEGFSDILPPDAGIFNTFIVPLLACFIFLSLGFWVFHREKSQFSDFI